jgi:hypothetical protein
MADVPPAAQRPEGTKCKKPAGLTAGCRFILWCCAGLAALGALSICPIINQRTHQTRHRGAQWMAIATSNGIEQFRADYPTLPLPSTPGPSGGDTDTDTSSAHSFITMLKGKETESGNHQNPRSVDFLEGINAAKKARPDEASPVWTNGLFFDEATGHYGIVDAWGTPYRIRLDTNNDKSVLNPNADQLAEGRTAIPTYVIVWSAGRDRDWDTWDDNPMSWY